MIPIFFVLEQSLKAIPNMAFLKEYFLNVQKYSRMCHVAGHLSHALQLRLKYAISTHVGVAGSSGSDFTTP